MMARTNHRISPVLKRKSDTRRPKQNILIVCEGEQTEPNYLAGWMAAHGVNEKAAVRVVGMGESTGKLLEVRQYGDEAAAVERAKMLIAAHGEAVPSMCEPGTTIHELLKALNELK